MKRYVALLRGINVGGNNKVDMKKLRVAFETHGFLNISTYINSGNIIFDTDLKSEVAIVKKIEKAILADLELPIRVVIRDKANIEYLCKKIPTLWTNNTENRTEVLFLWDEFAKPDSLKHIKTTEVDTLKYLKSSIVWHIARKDYSKSGLSKFIGTVVYKNMTARNINTVRKLGELMK